MLASAGVRIARIPRGPLFSMFLFTLLLSILIPLLIPYFPQSSSTVNNFLQRNLFNVSKRHFVSDSQTSSHGYQSGNSQSGSQSNGQQTTSDSSGPFTYKSSVAYQPKDRDDAIYQKLKDSLLSPTGEDNYFITTNSVSDVYAGVADGVGGWAEHGYDSSAISRELCKAMDQLSGSLTTDLSKSKISNLIVTPKEIIDLAYNKIKDEKIVEVGGTTAIIAHFPQDGLLKVANLGDSWCGVFRDSKLVFQTKFQTVGFNAPYQLSIIPEEMERQARLSGRSYIQNIPKDADEYEFQLNSKDVVILATDGVTDNIATDDIELFLKDNQELLSNDLNKTSKTLVQNIVKLSKDPEYPSVFAQEISKLSGKLYKGGKEDDITMVLVKVD
ncbi:protein phosphatase 2C homolog 7, mitochondrial [Monosporozyma unispora]|nr:hypothetical protein C6P44_003414 [Kazachstania unispora]